MVDASTDVHLRDEPPRGRRRRWRRRPRGRHGGGAKDREGGAGAVTAAMAPAPEAAQTLQWLEANRQHLALFICGRFDLVHGAQVALRPEKYGIREVWHVAGDEFLSGLFYEEARPAKTERDRRRFEAALDRLAEQWRLHRYPWAGSLSTAHTLLWYDHFGADAFRRFAAAPKARRRAPSLPAAIARMAERARQRDAEIWQTMIYETRAVSPALYHQLAAAQDRAPRRRGK